MAALTILSPSRSETFTLVDPGRRVRDGGASQRAHPLAVIRLLAGVQSREFGRFLLAPGRELRDPAVHPARTERVAVRGVVIDHAGDRREHRGRPLHTAAAGSGRGCARSARRRFAECGIRAVAFVAARPPAASRSPPPSRGHTPPIRGNSPDTRPFAALPVAAEQPRAGHLIDRPCEVIERTQILRLAGARPADQHHPQRVAVERRGHRRRHVDRTCPASSIGVHMRSSPRSPGQ